MKKIGLDFARPFNIPNQSPQYVLVAVDYCTRFVFLFPAGRISARRVVKSLERIRGAFEHIETIVTDNASCFRSAALTEHLEAVGTSQIRASIGHPQANGLAERTIRTLTDRLVALGRGNLPSESSPKSGILI